MRQRLLVCAATATFFAAPMPAFAEQPWDSERARSAALKWELGYLALSAVDAAQTIDCLDHDRCEEGNPLFGKHPSSKKVIAAKIGLGAIHFMLFNRLNDRNPKAAMRLAQISFAAQGAVVGLNARFTFK